MNGPKTWNKMIRLLRSFPFFSPLAVFSVIQEERISVGKKPWQWIYTGKSEKNKKQPKKLMQWEFFGLL